MGTDGECHGGGGGFHYSCFVGEFSIFLPLSEPGNLAPTQERRSNTPAHTSQPERT